MSVKSCINKIKTPGASEKFDNLVKGGMDEHLAAREVVVDEYKLLHGRLNSLKSTLSIPVSDYVVPELPADKISDIEKKAKESRDRIAATAEEKKKAKEAKESEAKSKKEAEAKAAEKAKAAKEKKVKAEKETVKVGDTFDKNGVSWTVTEVGENRVRVTNGSIQTSFAKELFEVPKAAEQPQANETTQAQAGSVGVVDVKKSDKLIDIIDVSNEPNILGKEVDVYDYQDKNAEKIISKHWNGEGGNVWRYKFENAGDILRELSKYSDGSLDPSYLYEKVNKIQDFIKKFAFDGELHYSDRYSTLLKENGENLTALRKAYENQPTKTEAQEKAKSLILNLIDGKLKFAEEDANWFDQFREGDTKENLQKANVSKQKSMPPQPQANETTQAQAGSVGVVDVEVPKLNTRFTKDQIAKVVENSGVTEKAAVEILHIMATEKSHDVARARVSEIIKKDQRTSMNPPLKKGKPMTDDDLRKEEPDIEIIDATKDFEGEERQAMAVSANTNFEKALNDLRADGRVQFDSATDRLEGGEDGLFYVITGDRNKRDRGVASAILAAHRLINDKNSPLVSLFSRVGKKIRLIYSNTFNIYDKKGKFLKAVKSWKEAKEFVGDKEYKIVPPPIMAADDSDSSIIINAYMLNERLEEFGGEKRFFNWLEMALYEEAIHLAQYQVATDVEMNQIAKEMSTEEKELVADQYGVKVADLTNFQMASEYVRQLVQHDLFGTTTELLKPKTAARKYLSNLLKKLIEFFAGKKDKISDIIVKRIENTIRGVKDNTLPKIESVEKQVSEKPKAGVLEYGPSPVYKVSYKNYQFAIKQLDTDSGPAFFEVEKVKGKWQAVKLLGYSPSEAMVALKLRVDEDRVNRTSVDDSTENVIIDAETGGNVLNTSQSYSDNENVIERRRISNEIRELNKELFNIEGELASAPLINKFELNKRLEEGNDRLVQLKNQLNKLRNESRDLNSIVPVGGGIMDIVAQVSKNTNIGIAGIGEEITDPDLLIVQLRHYDDLAESNEKLIERVVDEISDDYYKRLPEYNRISKFTVSDPATDELIINKGEIIKVAHIKKMLKAGIQDIAIGNVLNTSSSYSDDWFGDMYQEFHGKEERNGADPIADYNIKNSGKLILSQIAFTHAKRANDKNFDASEYMIESRAMAQAEWDIGNIVSDIFLKYDFESAFQYFVDKISDNSIEYEVRRILARKMIEKFESRPDIVHFLRVKLDRPLGSQAGSQLVSGKDFKTREKGNPENNKEQSPVVNRVVDTKGMWGKDLSEAQENGITGAVASGEMIVNTKVELAKINEDNSVSEEVEQMLGIMLDQSDERIKELEDEVKQLREKATKGINEQMTETLGIMLDQSEDAVANLKKELDDATKENDEMEKEIGILHKKIKTIYKENEIAENDFVTLVEILENDKRKLERKIKKSGKNESELESKILKLERQIGRLKKRAYSAEEIADLLGELSGEKIESLDNIKKSKRGLTSLLKQANEKIAQLESRIANVGKIVKVSNLEKEIAVAKSKAAMNRMRKFNTGEKSDKKVIQDLKEKINKIAKLCSM